MTTPKEVLDALDKLDAIDKDIVVAYINDLQSKLGLGDETMENQETEQEVTVEEDTITNDEAPFPPVYESGDDFDKATELKQEASELQASCDWEAALEKYTAAIQASKPSPLLLANRATVLLELGRPRAAERDCNLALEENPDSAKALRVRGKARKELGLWEAALKDLSASQQIDFEEGTVEVLKFLTEKRIEAEKADATKRNEEEERLRKRAAEIKNAQEEAKKAAADEARSSGGGMPDFGGMGGGMPGGMPGMGGGMPGGMPGMGGGMPRVFGDIMSDPEIMQAMQNPKVMQAFLEVQSNPGKIAELMTDPDVGPVVQKLMAKMGGGMGGGVAMPGGFGGASDMNADDDIPNINEFDDGVDLDELPDLE